MTSDDLTADDIELLIGAQDLPIDPEPYKRLAEGLGRTEDDVIHRLVELREMGVIRRMAGRIPHRNVGYKGNIMTVLNVPEEELDAVGKAISTSEHVSHCYSRNGWLFNMFFMVHGKDHEEGIAKAKAVLKDVGGDYEHDFLLSSKEFKKESFMLKDWKNVLKERTVQGRTGDR